MSESSSRAAGKQDEDDGGKEGTEITEEDGGYPSQMKPFCVGFAIFWGSMLSSTLQIRASIKVHDVRTLRSSMIFKPYLAIDNSPFLNIHYLLAERRVSVFLYINIQFKQQGKN